MAFITIAGENKIAYQQGNSLLLNITHFVLANIAGLGAEPADRIEGLPAAGNIVHTQLVTKKGYVNANQVVYSLAMDSTIGDFDFNWVGLKDADGVLIACAHITSQHKAANAGAVPGNNLTRNFLLAFSGIAATTAIAVPAETWQIDFTTRLLQIDERERLSNFDIYGESSYFGDGFKVSLQSGSTYQMAAGIGYVGGIRCEQLAVSTINVTGLPKSIWMDASLQGDINGVSAVFSFTATTATLADYTDANGFHHYVTKIADISAGGVITDLRHIHRLPSSVVGSCRNIRMSVAAASSTANLTADEIVVSSSLGGVSHVIASFNKNINLAATGAGGMDTGSPPNSGFVALYAIYNPSTEASALLAVNATAAIVPEVYGGANMPAGYTLSTLISVWPTNSSGQLKVGFQIDRHVNFQEIQVLSNLLNSPYVQFSISAAVPFNAKECCGRLTVIATTSTVTVSDLYLASDVNGSGEFHLQVPGNAAALGTVVPFSHLQLLTPQTGYYGTANGNGNAVFISGYSF